MMLRRKPRVPCLRTVTIFFLFALGQLPALTQEAPQKPTEKPAAKSSEKTGSPEKAENPAQIELLETKVRFETNGDSRKEVHALVKINSELGVRQFARLNFDFNRSFESVEIPLVHITHASGGTADILPGAITDQPNPAVVNAPAYQDVRVKSVRILGLQPGDTLEYRVIRAVSHHPLAPDFWLDHTFDRTGVVSHEVFEVDVPVSSKPQIQVNPATPATISEKVEGRRLLYRWQPALSSTKPDKETDEKMPDVMVTTFPDWDALSVRLAESLLPSGGPSSKSRLKSSQIEKEATTLSRNVHSLREKLETIYDFVSEKVATVDLPLGSTGFVGRSPNEILASGYATAEDKYVLFEALSQVIAEGYKLGAYPELVGAEKNIRDQPPRPSPFTHLLIGVAFVEDNSLYCLDPSVEVAPFNMVASNYRGAPAYLIAPANPNSDVVDEPWEVIPDRLPFPAIQNVSINASIGSDGKLTAKVHYSMRGDNELLLRLAFHQSLKEKWKEVAQLLSISDGFRGQVVNASASDPYATKEPFTVEYELEQPKFVDWTNKTVRIPALLPQLGLPDALAKSAAGSATVPIELGTPLEVETQMKLHLPTGTIAQTPTGTSVERDYATYSSQYSAKGSTLTASRHIHFLLRQIPSTRAADYNAFLHAVQSDEAQDFSLESPAVPSSKPAAPKDTSPPGPRP